MIRSEFSFFTGKLIISYEVMILSFESLSFLKKVNHLLWKYDIFVRKYDLSKKVNYFFWKHGFSIENMTFARKLVISQQIIMFSFLTPLPPTPKQWNSISVPTSTKVQQMSLCEKQKTKNKQRILSALNLADLGNDTPCWHGTTVFDVLPPLFSHSVIIIFDEFYISFHFILG